MGKKPVLTKKQKAFLEIFKKNACLVGVSTQKAKIHRNTYYLWMEKSETFKTEVEQAQEEFLDFGEAQLIQLLKEKNPSIVMHFAKTKLRGRGYAERQELEVTGSVIDIAKTLHVAYEQSKGNDPAG